MEEAGFPGQHVTHTTVHSSTSVVTTIRFDPNYLKTVPGILKAVQVFVNLLGFILAQVSLWSYHSRGQYFCWISMIAFWFTGILLGLYLFHFVEKFYKIPWLRVELVFCAIWSFLYLIAAALLVSVYDGTANAAGFFGFAAMIAYGIDAVLKYLAVRGGGLAQGTRVISKQTTTTVNSPPPREGY